MKGWTEQRGIIARPGRRIFRCEGPLCGAQVGVDATGEDRRRAHDFEFHVEDKPEAIAEHREEDRALAAVMRRFINDPGGSYVAFRGDELVIDGYVTLTESEEAAVVRLCAGGDRA